VNRQSDNSFPRRLRLTLGRDFLAARRGGVRASAGPLLVQGIANEAGVTRLGLSISSRLGTAVARNALKRRLREAFRLTRMEMPQGYDLLISARAHELLSLVEYQRLVLEAAGEVDRTWRKKMQRRSKA